MKRTLFIGMLAVIVVAGAVWGFDRLGVRVTIVDDGQHGDPTPVVDVDMNSTGEVMLAWHGEAEPEASGAIYEPVAYQNEAAEGGESAAPEPFGSEPSEQVIVAETSPFLADQGPTPDVVAEDVTFANDAVESEPQLPEGADAPSVLESSDAVLLSPADDVASNPGDVVPNEPTSLEASTEFGQLDSSSPRAASGLTEPAAGDDFVAADPSLADDVFGGAPDWTDENSAFQATIGAAIASNRHHNERIRILTLELWDKLEQLGSSRHPFVEKARKALEFEVRRGIQSRHEQQRQEISRLRNRLNTIEQRLTDRVKREDHLIQASMNTLLRELNRQRVFSASPFQVQPGSTEGGADVGDPFASSPSPASANGGDEAEPALSDDPSDVPREMLEQLTVRVTCSYERNEGFPPEESNFDGVLLAEHGFIVSAFPEEMTSEDVAEVLEISVVFPATGTASDARLVAVDERTGLAILEPDLFPDSTPDVELTFDEIATGDPVLVATVEDGHLNPDEIAVAILPGHARRLVGKPRTISRLATDIPSRPGNGGAPLVTEDGRLGGVMSALDPGQYIGTAKIEHLLKNLITGSGQVGRMGSSGALRRWMDGASRREVFTDTRVQRTLDYVFNLHHNVSSSRYEVDQTQLEVDRLEPLVESGAASTAELEKAKLANEQARKRLQAFEKQVGLKRQTADLSGRYAEAAMKTAAAAYQEAVDANRKVPGSVPDEELRKMSLEVEQRRLEIHLVRQTLELIEEIVAEMDAREDDETDSPSGTADDAETTPDASSASVPRDARDSTQVLPGALFSEGTDPKSESASARNIDPFGGIRGSDQLFALKSRTAPVAERPGRPDKESVWEAPRGLPENSLESVAESAMNAPAILERVEQLRAGIAIAKRDLEVAWSELGRVETLTENGAASTDSVENARRAFSTQRLKLFMLKPLVDAWHHHCMLVDRYAESALEVAKVEVGIAVRTNEKVPGTVSEPEMSKLELEVREWELRLDYVRQALEVLKQNSVDPNAFIKRLRAEASSDEVPSSTEPDPGSSIETSSKDRLQSAEKEESTVEPSPLRSKNADPFGSEAAAELSDEEAPAESQDKVAD